MNREQYLKKQEFFKNHKYWRKIADFFATKIVYFFIFLPLAFVYSSSGRAFVVSGALVSLFGKLVLAKVLAYLFPSPRPYEKFNFIPVAGLGLFSKVTKKMDAFPSGHITAMAGFAGVLFQFHALGGLLVFIVVMCTAVSRVVLGFHYFRDVFSGFAMGLMLAYLVKVVGLLDLVVKFTA